MYDYTNYKIKSSTNNPFPVLVPEISVYRTKSKGVRKDEGLESSYFMDLRTSESKWPTFYLLNTVPTLLSKVSFKPWVTVCELSVIYNWDNATKGTSRSQSLRQTLCGQTKRFCLRQGTDLKDGEWNRLWKLSVQKFPGALSHVCLVDHFLVLSVTVEQVYTFHREHDTLIYLKFPSQYGLLRVKISINLFRHSSSLCCL